MRSHVSSLLLLQSVSTLPARLTWHSDIPRHSLCWWKSLLKVSTSPETLPVFQTCTHFITICRMDGSSWIEHDSNGRAYFVRRKPALPSVRQIVAEAFRDIRSNHSAAKQLAQVAPSTPQPTQGDAAAVPQHNIRDPASTGKIKTNLKKSQTFMPQAQQQQQQQRSVMAQDNSTASRQPTPNQPQPAYNQHPLPFYTFPFAPPIQGFAPQSHYLDKTKHDYPSQTNLGALTHYSSPHPRMYPFVPPGTQPVPPQPMMPIPIPGVVAGQVEHPTEPPTSQPFMTNFPPNASSLTSMHTQMYGMPFPHASSKIKCSECGRERSSKYQWKYRKSRGRKAEPNICRRCRKSGTESEYESDDSEYQTDRLRRSRSRRYSRDRTSRTHSRARSSSRPIRRGDFDFYAYQGISESGSDSEGYEDYQRKKGRSARRRNRSISAESDPVRGSHLHRSISRPRRVVYVEPPRNRSDFHSSDDNIEIRYVDQDARYVRG